jgi:hypothetical protein
MPVKILIVAQCSLRRAQLRLMYENRPGFIVVGELETPTKSVVIPCGPADYLVFESELDGEARLDHLLPGQY